MKKRIVLMGVLWLPLFINSWTLAETKFRGTCAEKIGDCTNCGFYNSVRAREDLPGTLRGAACRVA